MKEKINEYLDFAKNKFDEDGIVTFKKECKKEIIVIDVIKENNRIRIDKRHYFPDNAEPDSIPRKSISKLIDYHLMGAELYFFELMEKGWVPDIPEIIKTLRVIVLGFGCITYDFLKERLNNLIADFEYDFVQLITRNNHTIGDIVHQYANEQNCDVAYIADRVDDNSTYNAIIQYADNYLDDEVIGVIFTDTIDDVATLYFNNLFDLNQIPNYIFSSKVINKISYKELDKIIAKVKENSDENIIIVDSPGSLNVSDK